jgi:hypothetical protein
VNPKQAAAWLGHQDGGALLLRIYAHARKDHAQEEAAKVHWTKLPQQPEAGSVILNGVAYSRAALEALIKGQPAANGLAALPQESVR